MITRLATEAMGTRFELVLHGEDELFLRAAGEEAIELIQEQHTRLSAFAPGSLVSRINALAADRPVGVDQELWGLLDLCAQVWRQSEGAFDPAVGTLMKRWGFRGGVSQAEGADTRPPGFESVELDARARTVRFHEPGVLLDFGAVAKGFALDLAAEQLRGRGVRCALIHGGTSTSVGIGTAPDLSVWQVQIPSHAERVPPLRAGLASSSLSVSSPAGRTAHVRGEEVGHVMDPIAGRPALGAVVTAVAGESAAESDAWSTALVVLGARVASMPPGLVSAIRLPEQGWSLGPEDQTVFTFDA